MDYYWGILIFNNGFKIQYMSGLTSTKSMVITSNIPVAFSTPNWAAARSNDNSSDVANTSQAATRSNVIVKTSNSQFACYVYKSPVHINIVFYWILNIYIC